MSEILVTGIAGFIGSHVAERLAERGERVIGVDSVNDYYDPTLKEARLARLAERFGDAITMKRVDFADDEALDAALSEHDIDRIVHLGAQAGVRYSIENPRAYIDSNLIGCFNVL